MVDRVINYIGAVPLDVDLLNTNKNLMIGLGFALQAILGGSTVVDGLACTPTGPASQQVLIAQGSIYSTENVDGTAFGSLGSDTTHQILKQGLTALGNTAFTCAAPSTSGYSIAYLIQGEYQDVDGGSTVLPYYNATNPAVAYNGPANAGTSQNTVRQGKLVLNLKAGTAATTGTQVTPTPDAGFTGLWVVTVANGITAITSGMIALYPGAPFINYKLPQLSPSISPRTSLTGNANYYIAPTGSDSNPGTSGSPWLTRQHAYNWIQDNIDLAGFGVTVNVLSASSETYTDALNAVGPLTGNTNGANGIIFLGNSGTPDNAFINVSTGNCFGAQQGAVFSVNGFKVASGGSGVSGNGLFASINSYINYQNIDFGACGGSHRYASHNSFMQAGGNCSISGNAVYSMQSAPSGNIEENGTVTVVGTPAFSGAYAYASRNGVIEANHAGVTYVNPSNATGVQYDVENGGVINTGGASLSGYFPGSTAGVGTNFGTSPYGLII